MVVTFFSAKVGRPEVIIQPTTGSGDVAVSENRATILVMADNDGIS
jgi:hypothetical protein